MRRTRWILLFALLSLVVIGSWLLWVRPKKVDMAMYAPADSLLYLEANEPLDVFEAIAGTQAWRAVANVSQSQQGALQPHWLRGFVGWTGIGPVKSVILARSQVAVVVTDLQAVEEGDSLNIKSECALLIETHTAEGRIRSEFEYALRTLAEKTYGHPTARRVTVDGVQYSEWISSEGKRQIVGAVLGSLVVIGTSEHAVQNCLAVAQGRRPSLKDDPELQTMRLQLKAGNALSFGYVPPGNSARLLAVGLPLLLGRAPSDSEFQRLITNGASKVFGSLGWASRPYLTGVEDRYFINLQPSVAARLKPNFGPNNIKSQVQHVVPNDAYSVTTYKFANPPAAWLSLKTAVSSQVDALSAIVFSSLLKSALLSYGIEDPESFLGTVDGELFTLRLDETSERSLLIATVHDRAALRKLITKQMPVPSRNTSIAAEIFEDPTGEFAAGLSGEFVVIGSPVDVRHYSAIREDPTALASADTWRRMTFFGSANPSTIVTYTNDGDRVRRFISAIVAVKGGSTSTSDLEEAIAILPYSTTETTVGDRGVERTTRSPLGQFSSLLPLLFPQQSAAVQEPSPSR